MSRKSVSIAHGGKKGGGGIGATSLDRAVDERNAHFHKYGLTSVSVRMSMLFAGQFLFYYFSTTPFFSCLGLGFARMLYR